jgi:hypothetical protein
MSKGLYLPLKVFLTYIIFTVFVFAFGPWSWPARTSTGVYVLMLGVIGAMYIGYKVGMRRPSFGYYGSWSAIKLYRISVLISLLLFLPTLIWRTSGISIADTFLNFGEAYSQSHDVSSTVVGQTAWIEYVRMLLSVFLNLPILILITHWEKIRRSEKLLGILSIVLEIFLSLVVGTNIGFGHVFIFVLWGFAIRSRGLVSYKMLKYVLSFILPVFLVFFFVFTQGQIDRHDGVGVQDEISFLGISADRDNSFVAYLPTGAQEGVIAFSSYLTQGYQGLSYCLDLPFVPTWGAGNSRFLAAYADKYLDTSIEKNTYPMRAEVAVGWDSKVHWHTALPWFASDVTFIGAVLLMGFFSALMAMTWRDAIYSANPYAMSLFAQLAVMFSFISANNQAFQSGDGVIGFVVTLWCWFFTHRKIKWS